MNAQQLFKKAFGAIRAEFKTATTIGRSALIGVGHEGKLHISCGFEEKALFVGLGALGCVYHPNATNSQWQATTTASDCFAWRLYHAEHPVRPASERLAERRRIEESFFD